MRRESFVAELSASKYDKMQGPELVSLKPKKIQATMFKVTDDDSCCTDKCTAVCEL